MHVFCSICREKFLPGSKVNITQCGHLYHFNCLEKWYEKRTTCPQCRSSIWQRTQEVEFLFKEVPDKKFDSTSHEQLMNDYEVIRQEENELRSKYEELNSIQSHLKQKISECKTGIKNSEFDIVIWKNQCDVYDQVLDTCHQLLKENGEMEKKNKLLNKFDKLMNGSEAEMYKVLAGMTTNFCTIKELCTFVQAMKYKLRKNDDYFKKTHRNIIHATEQCPNEAVEENCKEKEEKADIKVLLLHKSIQTEPIKIKKFKTKPLKKPLLKPNL